MHFIVKYRYGLGVILSFLIFLGYNNYIFRTDFTSEIKTYQEKFREKTSKLDDFLNHKKKTLKFENISIHNRAELDESNFYLHIFRNDSLLFWNTNQLPVSRFSDLHFPSEGIIHLQNGWYYAKTIRLKNTVIVGSFLIKKEYPYENNTLQNSYNPDLKLPCKASVILEKDNAFPIYSSHKKFLFAWYIYPTVSIPSIHSDILLSLFCIFLSFLFLYFYRLSHTLSTRWFWLLIIGVILTRISSVQWHWFVFISGITSFQNELYTGAFWAPNFGEFIINTFTLVWVVFTIIHRIIQLKSFKYDKIIYFGFLIVILFFSFFLGEVFRVLIQNSTIPLKIDNLFELNFYSFMSFLAMGILFYSYYYFLKTIIQSLFYTGTSKKQILWFWAIISIIGMALDMTFGNQQFLLILLLSFITFIIVWFSIQDRSNISNGKGILFLFLFSFLIALNLEIFHTKKEQREREVIAKKLASEQDLETEKTYQTLSKFIQNDDYIARLIQKNHVFGISEFKENMEKQFFNGFWERYEIEFYLFNNENTSLINYTDIQSNNLSNLELIIHRHSLPSTLDNRMFYIKDYTSQYSYIIRQEIINQSKDTIGSLYCALKSKKIPEKIGFPRLLVSGEAHVIEPLEKYSMAKYYTGKLVSHNGKYSYPLEDFGILGKKIYSDGFYNQNGYSHYVHRKNYNDLIVLSIPNTSTLHWFTSCSYLFSFFGLFLLVPITIKNRERFIRFKELSFAIRIQMVLLGLVFVTLIVFGLGAGFFVTNQYKEYTHELMIDKIHSLERDIKQKYGSEIELTLSKNGNLLEVTLQDLASIFQTDINLYDQQGFLLASSRPKLFNIGIISEQLNPTALIELNQFRKSEFIHEETIGSLTFLSAYLPFYNNDGELLAYINLQHFGQQQGIELQLKQFLETLMNVSILLLAISVLFALFISSWVTKPLRMLKESISRVQLGIYNKPIAYSAKDEIGALVDDYNTKLNELALKTSQLAQSERESAWREMAKQVAHEIKNPLTPMKLNLQQLERVYDPEKPISIEKLQKITRSIIAQIDLLAKIANEFSHFAKLPKATEQLIDLIMIIESTITLFLDEEKASIVLSLNPSIKSAFVRGDKDLLLRVFTNLITNALQSIPAERKGKIDILIEETNLSYLIHIKDNGVGFSQELKEKIFEPYFTTKSSGTGLGLAMSKQIIQQYKGTILVESQVDKGTLFTIEFPKND